MQFRMKLAAVAASAADVALMLAGPAVASVPAGSPAWITGRELVHGQLHGKAAWVQATKANPRVPVKFRGVVRTRGVVGLGNSSSSTHSIRTRVGKFTVRIIRMSQRAKVLNPKLCRLQFTVNGTFAVRGRKSTDAFHGASGHGRLHIRFTFNYPRTSGGKCDYSTHAIPSRRGGLIAFRLVIPALRIR